MRRSWRAVALAAATITAAVAGGVADPATAASGSVAAPVGAPARATADPDGVLRLATFAEYPWDPHLIPSTFAISQLSMVYDRLIHNAPNGDLIPGLAETWTYGDDGLSLTFALRDGVVFQDGATFDADAVKANLDRALTIEGSTVAAEMANITEVVVDDPLTVTLVLAAPDATLPAVLSGLAGMMISPDAMDDPELDQHPVGAGMYQLVELVQGSSFRVERWDGYWDPDAVANAAIEMNFMPDTNVRVNALLTDELDVAPIEPLDVDRIESTDGLSVSLNNTLRFLYLGFDLSKPPFDDIRVRQAIAHAINRQALVDAVWLGFGTPSEQIWPEGFYPHVPELDDMYPYDPERARELLAEAGLADGFSFETICVPQPAAYQQLGEAIQAQLADVGIDMQLRLTEPTQLGPAYYVDKTVPSALLYTNGRLDPSITVGTRYTEAGFFNVGKVSTPRLEELYVQSVETTDQEARVPIFQDINREITENLLEQVLFFSQEPVAVADRVVGYEVYVSGQQEYRGMGVTS